jgi:uncharacterized protein YbaR (Trm112 family)
LLWDDSYRSVGIALLRWSRSAAFLNLGERLVIDKDLLEILVCPEDHSRLRPPDETLLAKVNQAIDAGRLKNRAGEMVEAPLEGGLVREDSTLLYPIIDDIPVLLIDEAIPLEQIE